MNRRDSYFQYLKDQSVPVPYTTAYNRIRKSENELLAGQSQVCTLNFTLFYQLFVKIKLKSSG